MQAHRTLDIVTGYSTPLYLTSQPGIKDPSPHLVYKIPTSMSHSPTYRIVCFPKFSQGSYITHFSLPLIVRANVR